MHDGTLTCTRCGSAESAELIIYGGHECDPQAEIDYSLVSLEAELADGSFMARAEHWVETNSAAAKRRAFSAFRRDAATL